LDILWKGHEFQYLCYNKEQDHKQRHWRLSPEKVCILVGSVLIIFLVFCAVIFVLLFFILCLLSNVVCVSGLTILDYHFGFLQRLFNK
jgi:hypothetical protein